MDIVNSGYAEAEEEGCFLSFVRMVVVGLCHLLMIIPIFWLYSFKTIRQYERIVVFRLGKAKKQALGPGLAVLVPFVDTYKTVDLRIQTCDVPTQELLTRDSVTTGINAVVFSHVRDAVKAVLAVDNYTRATDLLAQTTLRSVVGEYELDDILQRREDLNSRMTAILDSATDAWGVKVVAVEIKDVILPQNMQRAMASQAEAERERRSKIISSEGEVQASENLLRAADTMSRNANTMQLRLLQTLTQVSVENNSTIIFPLPIELMAGMGARIGEARLSGLAASAPALPGATDAQE